MNLTRQHLLESLLRRLCPQRVEPKPELAEALRRWRLEHMERETAEWKPFAIEWRKR